MCKIYYSLDEEIYYKILFLNLSPHNRDHNIKLLENTSNVSKMRQIPRLYDNFIRIYEYIINNIKENNINDLVSKSFHITSEMTRYYVNMSFIIFNKMEMKKRKFIPSVRWEDLHKMIDDIINNLTLEYQFTVNKNLIDNYSIESYNNNILPILKSNNIKVEELKKRYKKIIDDLCNYECKYLCEDILCNYGSLFKDKVNVIDFKTILSKCDNKIDLMIFKILNDLKDDLLGINQLIRESNCFII